MKNILKKSNYILSLVVVIMLGGVFLLANDPRWRGHLEVDAWTWFSRVEFFKINHSFNSLQGNELLPATLLFLFIPAIITGWHNLNYLFYLQAVLIINVVICGLIIKTYMFKKSNWQRLIGPLLLLAIGPIILFRFDTLVMLLILLSLVYWQKKLFKASGFLLGWSMAMKVFPVILVLYLSGLLWKNKKYSELIEFLIFIGIAIYISVIAFILLGGNIGQILSALKFHSLKPISIESTMGSIITAKSLIINGWPPSLLGVYGLWGIKSNIKQEIINYFWIIPVAFVYFQTFVFKKLSLRINIGIMFLLMLTFLIFSKNLHPQYLLWFVALLPMVKVIKNGLKDYLIIFSLLVLTALITQIIYPLNYSAFVNTFYATGQQIELYYLQLMRNLMLILVWLISYRAIMVKRVLR